MQRLLAVTRSSSRRTRSCQKRGTLGHTGRLSVKNFSMKFLSIHSLVRKKIKVLIFLDVLIITKMNSNLSELEGQVK